MAPDPSLFLSPLGPADPVPGEEGSGEQPTGDEPGGEHPAGHGPGRWRRAVAPLVVTVLVLGAVAANRGGGGADARSERAAATTTTTAVRARPGGAVPTPAPTTTTSTTTLGPALTTVARRGPLLPDVTGTTLVLNTSERLVVAELDTGTIRMAATPGLALGGGQFSTVVPVGTALLVGGADPRLVERSPGGVALDVGRTATGGLLPSAVPGRWWAVDHRFSVELVEHDVDGETGRRLSLPGESSAVLPFGDGFLVSPAGSVLEVDATTGRARRIADGTVVAVDDRTLVRTRCDEVLECGLVLSDHGGGAERTIGTPTPRSRYEVYAGPRFSPDGRWLVVPFYGEDQPGGLVLIDVERGERRAVDTLATASGGGFAVSAAFTADSRWLLFGDAAGEEAPIRALRIEDGATAEIDLGVRGPRSHGSASFVALPSVPGDVG